MHSEARCIIEVALEVNYYESEIIVGRTTILWLETFLQNFVGCLRQSVSRLTKLIDSFDHELLGVTSEEPIRRQNEKIIVAGDFLPHDLRFRDYQSLVFSVPKSSGHCELTLNFSSQYRAVRPQNSFFFVGSRWRVV